MSRIIMALLIIVFMAHGASWAASQTFREDFSGGALDSTKWITMPGDGEITLGGGTCTLASGPGYFPYLEPRTQTISAGLDYVVKIRARYLSVRVCGNGFGAIAPGLAFPTISGFSYWQDNCCGPLRVSVGDLFPIYVGTGLDTDFHIYEWTCLGSTIQFRFDGQLVATDQTDLRPTNFFIGHPPVYGCPSPNWTSQEIDFVEVGVLGATGVRLSSWGALKSLYR